MKIRLLLAAALASAISSAAFAQGLPSANQVYAGPTSGSPSAPAFRLLMPADLPSGSASGTLDTIGSTRGSVLERGASGWQIIPPSSTSGLPWVSAGPGADPGYGQTVNAGLANMGPNSIKCVPTGSSGTPQDCSASAALSGMQFGLLGSSISTPGGTMSGYAAGDRITLQCTGITFSVSPIMGVTAVSGGSITSTALTVPGITTSTIPTLASCSQASTTGSGTGYTVTASFGIYAAYIQNQSLTTGGSGASNGNFYLNLGPNDSDNLFANYAGSEGTFIGDKAGHGLNGFASFSTAVGHNACGSGGSGGAGASQTCIGNDSGRNNQDPNGSNVIIGQGAGRNIANGFNTYVGSQAAGSNQVNTPGALTGSNNVSIGFQTLNALTTGSGNTCLGTKSCSAIATGAGNVIIGATSGADNCANGDETDVFAVCPGAGRVLTITGGGTPSSSAASVAGSLTGGSGLANNIKITGNTAGNSPTVQAAGSDTNINLNLFVKGSGQVFIGGGTGNGTVNLLGSTSGSASLTTTSTGGPVQTGNLALTSAAPTVSAGQIGYGGTTVSAGSGTCPSGTVGGQTVQGCIVVNIAGTARNVPFF